MYVCSCRGVTDHKVLAAIAAGAHSTHDIARDCGAGAHCGGCWPELQRLLAEHADATEFCAERIAS